MRAMPRLPCWTAVLLLAVPFCGCAQAGLPDPVAPAVVGRPLDTIRPVRPKTVAAAPAAPTAVLGNAAAPRAPKPALDDRADPRAAAAGDVGQGSHLGRKPLPPGAYIGGKYQKLVHQYYDAHPWSGRAAQWSIGEPLPRGTRLAGIPDALRARLPAVPPGHRYVQVGGDVVLLAVQSRMVVDGVSRGAP